MRHKRTWHQIKKTKKDFCIKFWSFFKGCKFTKMHFTNANRCAKIVVFGVHFYINFRVPIRLGFLSHFQWFSRIIAYNTGTREAYNWYSPKKIMGDNLFFSSFWQFSCIAIHDVFYAKIQLAPRNHCRLGRHQPSARRFFLGWWRSSRQWLRGASCIFA